MIPRSFLERGGAIRPARSRTALLVSVDPAVRSDWTRYVEALGMRTLRCAGPEVLCVLLDGAHCPLHEEADLGIYDRAALTPELTFKLIRVSHALPIGFAKDQLDPRGHHQPLITSVASEGADACIGSAIHGLVR